MDEIALTAGLVKQDALDRFEEILRRHDRQVYAVALRVLGSRDDAQDAAQEVFLRLHRSLKGLRDQDDYGPWLYRVTVNVCHDMLRKRRTVPLPQSIALSGACSPEERANQEQRRRSLLAALQRLPEKERMAIILRDIEGLSTSEVAEALDSSETTVRSQISVARAKLRGWLNERRP